MLDVAPVGKANGQRQQAGGEAGPQAPGVGGQCPPVTPRAEPRLLRAAWPRAVGMRGHRADQEEGGRPGRKERTGQSRGRRRPCPLRLASAQPPRGPGTPRPEAPGAGHLLRAGQLRKPQRWLGRMCARGNSLGRVSGNCAFWGSIVQVPRPGSSFEGKKEPLAASPLSGEFRHSSRAGPA